MEQEVEQSPKTEYIKMTFEEGNFLTTYTKKFSDRKKYVPPDFKKVFAFIPGTIVKVYVKEKHKVKKGEALISLQAMKMNNILVAPMAGVIKKVNCKAGDSVPKSQVLVEFK
jgi:acetyl/propionyl-CoA carboxylase alpha subunit